MDGFEAGFEQKVFSAFGIRNEELSEIREFANEVELDKVMSDAVDRKTGKDGEASEQ